MQSRAAAALDLNRSLKRTRDDLKPVQQQLISDMVDAGTKVLPVGDGIMLRLVEKKVKKAVTTRALYNAITTKWGAQACTDVKAQVEKQRGEPQSKYGLKFEDTTD